MAEALVNRGRADRGLFVAATSAGIDPGAGIDPIAEAVMSEIGISLDGHYPRLLAGRMISSADYVVLVAAEAESRRPALKWLPDDVWWLGDVSGWGLEKARRVREHLLKRVDALLAIPALGGDLRRRTAEAWKREPDNASKD